MDIIIPTDHRVKLQYYKKMDLNKDQEQEIDIDTNHSYWNNPKESRKEMQNALGIKSNIKKFMRNQDKPVSRVKNFQVGNI